MKKLLYVVAMGLLASCGKGYEAVPNQSEVVEVLRMDVDMDSIVWRGVVESERKTMVGVNDEPIGYHLRFEQGDLSFSVWRLYSGEVVQMSGVWDGKTFVVDLGGDGNVVSVCGGGQHGLDFIVY
jgi:hypothetical protein